MTTKKTNGRVGHKPPDRTHYGDDRKQLVVELGKLLRAAREEKGLSTRGLAALADVPQCTVLRYEYGQREPRILNLVRICHAMDITNRIAEFLEKSAGKC